MSKRVLKTGEILSETAFYTVVKVLPDGAVEVSDDNGNTIGLSKGYVDSDVLVSADFFESEEEKTATELAEIFINSPRIAMSVQFYKKDKKKTPTAIKKETAEWVAKVKAEFMADGGSAIDKYASMPVLDYIPGELRTMKGRHYGGVDEFGRMHFTDMEEAKGDNPAYDARMRQVDPRTLVSVTVNKVRYNLKKK